MRILVGAIAVLPLMGCATQSHQHMPEPDPFGDQYWAAQGQLRVGQEFVHEGNFQNGVTVTPAKNIFFGQGESYAPDTPVAGGAVVAANQQPAGYKGTPVLPSSGQVMTANGPQTLPDRQSISGKPNMHAYAPTLPPRANGGQQLLVEGEFINQQSARYGGVVEPGSRTAMERGSARSDRERMALKNLDIAGRFWGARPYERLDEAQMRMMSQDPGHGGFSENALLAHLDMLDPSRIDLITGNFAGLKEKPPVVHFKTGKSDIQKSDKTALNQFAAKMANYDNLLMIGGYTDPQGDMKINTPLSLNRARNTAKQLVLGGVRENVILLFGEPQCCYVGDNATESGRQQNRRTEIKIGGGFVRADADDNARLALAMARVFKTIGGKSSAQIRVHGIAGTKEAATSLAERVKTFLMSPEVGLRNVGIGEPGQSSRKEIVLEIVGQIGD